MKSLSDPIHPCADIFCANVRRRSHIKSVSVVSVSGSFQFYPLSVSQGLHTESAGVLKFAQVAAKFDGVM